MTEPTIRLHLVDEAGTITDGGREFRLADFAGFLPAPGDRIVVPPTEGGPIGEVLIVASRVFNPRGLADYVALVCQRRAPAPDEIEIMPDEDD